MKNTTIPILWKEFSSEISSIDDKKKLTELRRLLISARNYCNMVRVYGDEELKNDFKKLVFNQGIIL